VEGLQTFSYPSAMFICTANTFSLSVGCLPSNSHSHDLIKNWCGYLKIDAGGDGKQGM